MPMQPVRLIHLATTFILLTLSATWAADVPVHYFDCKNCHMSGLSLAQIGGANVCLTCHEVGKPDVLINQPPPAGLDGHTDVRFTSGDSSDSFGNNPLAVKQTSHNWAAPTDNLPAAGAQSPDRTLHPEFYSHYGTSNDRVTCSRCHNPHATMDYSPILLVKGGSNAEAMCQACHLPWAAQMEGNHGWLSHPMITDYNATVQRAEYQPGGDKDGWLKPTPVNIGNAELQLITTDGFNNGVGCTSCHGVHFADSDATTGDGSSNRPLLQPSGGRLLRGDGPQSTDKSSLCQTCHDFSQHGDNSGEQVGCLVCHSGHSYDPVTPNYFLLRKTTTSATFGTVSGLDYSSPNVLDTGLKYTFWNDETDGTADGYCEKCHGDAASLPGSVHSSAAVCTDCHTHNPGGSGSFGHGGGGNCEECHGHDAGYEYAPGQFSEGHGTSRSHSTHTEGDSDDLRGPYIGCNTCHDTDNFPYFKSGTDNNGDGRYDLTETDVCAACHSPGGAFNGVNTTGGSVGAKDNWPNGIYAADNTLLSGKKKWCIGCHDSAPAIVNGETAVNKAGDNSTYGYYVTGHGRTDSYARMSWQNNVATGNPGAGQGCTGCHDSTSQHIYTSGSSTRLTLANDQNNSNCSTNCHKAGGSATAAPQWFTTSAEYENSAHSGTLCTNCHDVHGADGVGPAMTKADQESLCYQCHTEGAVMNNALSGSVDDIQEAFSQGERHNLGSSFSVGGNNYSLECVSCHNVHIVTGKHWDVEQGLSPVTKFTDNLQVWGDEPSEKMDNYAAQASGTGGWAYSTARGNSIIWDQPGKYQPPKKGSGYDFEFSGDVLPDYTTFCLDCHSSSGIPGHASVNWGGDAHGKSAANKPAYVSDSGTPGFWGSSGNPDMAYHMNYVTRGRGSAGHFMRWPYETADRSAGVNFVMACTDCHEAHGSGVSSMLRNSVNNGPGSWVWNDMCNNCHYYYGGQHAGMSCGNASCHVQNSIHGMDNDGGGGGTAIHLTAVGFEADYVKPDFTPEIEMISSHIGSNQLEVTFRESQYGSGTQGVYAKSDLSEALTADDFWFFDKGNNNPRTITGVAHTAGEMTATLTMSSPVVEADLSTDTLAMKPASAWAWYTGGYSNAATGTIPAQAVSAGPWPATVTGPPPFNIQGVLYGRLELKLNGIVEDSDQLYVTFAEGAYANADTTGALQSGDFDVICGGRTVSSVAHTAGDTFAVLTLDSIVNQSEIGVCTVAAVSNSIYDSYGNPAGTDAVTLTLPPEASVNDLVLRWDFNEASGVAQSTGTLGTQEDMHGALTRNVVRVASTIPGKAAGDNVVKFDRDDIAVSDRGAVQLNYEIDSGDGFPAKFTNVQETQYTGEFTFSVWIKPTALGCQEGQDRGLNVKLRRDVVTTQFWVKNWGLGIMRFSPDGDPIAGNCGDDPDDTGPLPPYDADETHDVLRFWVSVGDPADLRCDPWGGTMPEAVLPENPAGYYQGGWITGTCGDATYPMPTNKWTHAFAQTETAVSGAPTYSGVALQPGVWQHIVGTWDGRYIRIYIDGQLAAETDMGGAGNYVMLADPLLWGGDLLGDGSLSRHVSSFFAAGARPIWSSSGSPSGGAAYWNANGFYDLNNSTYVGELDDVKYWKKALPLTTIQN